MAIAKRDVLELAEGGTVYLADEAGLEAWLVAFNDRFRHRCDGRLVIVRRFGGGPFLRGRPPKRSIICLSRSVLNDWPRQLGRMPARTAHATACERSGASSLRRMCLT